MIVSTASALLILNYIHVVLAVGENHCYSKCIRLILLILDFWMLVKRYCAFTNMLQNNNLPYVQAIQDGLIKLSIELLSIDTPADLNLAFVKFFFWKKNDNAFFQVVIALSPGAYLTWIINQRRHRMCSP